MRNQKTIALRKAKTKKQWNEEMKKGRSLAYSGKNSMNRVKEYCQAHDILF